MMIVAASLGLNVFLGLKLRHYSLRDRGELLEGTFVPDLVVTDLDGKTQRLIFAKSSAPVVLYVFSPYCGWCDRNLANVAALAESVTGRYNFIGISLSHEGLEEYVKTHRISFQTYGNLRSEAREGLSIHSTPVTIVVSRDSHVLRSWTGAYDQSMLHEIEAYFGTHLPGLTGPRPSESADNLCRDGTGLGYSVGAVIDNRASGQSRCDEAGHWVPTKENER